MPPVRSQQQVQEARRYLADMRCEDAEREATGDRDRQQERPHKDSRTNRCRDHYHNYTCGHRDTREVRDAKCWVCKAEGRFCRPDTVDLPREGCCLKCWERKERDKLAEEAKMEREARRRVDRRRQEMVYEEKDVH